MTRKTIEQMLDELGECQITLWVHKGSAQANTKDAGSDGWSCQTEPMASEALRKALEHRLQLQGFDAARARGENPHAAPAVPTKLVRAVKAMAPLGPPVKRLVRRK